MLGRRQSLKPPNKTQKTHMELLFLFILIGVVTKGIAGFD